MSGKTLTRADLTEAVFNAVGLFEIERDRPLAALGQREAPWIEQGRRRIESRVGTRAVDQHDIGAEALAGDLEGRLGPRRGLEKEIDLGAAGEERMALLDLAVHFDVFFGEVEKGHDFGGGKLLDSQKVRGAEDRARARRGH